MPINSLLYPSNVFVPTTFDVDNSVRMDGSSKFTRSFGSAGNRKKWTMSMWVKRGALSADQKLMGKYTSSSDRFALLFNGSDQLQIFWGNSGGNKQITTNRLFRDTSAFYNFTFIIDTGNSTESDRMQIWVNGVRETSMASTAYPTSGQDLPWNDSGVNEIGTYNNGNKFNGYLAEVVFQNDNADTPVDKFISFDEDSGICVPIDVSGLTLGTNGFYLDFEDSSALGNDASGSNNFTPSGIAAIDQTTDTCTNNFCTMNPLSSGMTLTEGNTNVAGAATAKSTFGVASGKWYVEMKATNAQTYNPIVGIATASSADSSNPNSSAHPGSFVESHGYDRSGVIKSNNNTAVQSGLTTSQSNGDIIGLAIDLDSGTKTAQWYVNGSSVGSAVTLVSNDAYVFMTYASGSQAGTGAWNFGNPSFTGTDKADGNGFGSFEYQPPSGYFALCTKNLAEYG